MMAVRDQELAGDLRRAFQSPEPLAVEREVGLARRQVDRVAVVEEEDRLELRARRAQEPQTTLPDLRVRALVRQDDAPVVRLQPERDDDAVPRARDAVGADVRLRQRPRGGLCVANDDAVRAPGGEVARRLLLRVRQGQVNHVVRAAREVLRALVRPDHVVRRSDKVLELAGALAVPLGTEGTHLGHGWTVP